MSSSYPNSVKHFTTKRNLLEDVDASHVNDIQNEVTSIETTLGAIPHIDTNSPWGTRRTYADVASRLRSIQNGDQMPIAVLEGRWTPFKSHTEGYIHFRKVNDSQGNIFNGVDATLNATGWWRIDARVTWPYEPNGYRWMALHVMGTTVEEDEEFPKASGSKRSTGLSCSWMGLANKNMRVQLKLSQNSGKTLVPEKVFLKLALQRTYGAATRVI